jgi:hypothetical protein
VTANGACVNRLRRFGLPSRLLLAALLALCLGVRLLTPAGFMPAFASGSLAIVPCPDAEGPHQDAATLAMPGMDMSAMDMPGMGMPDAGQHDGRTGFHQACPYAASASLAGLLPGLCLLILVVLLAASLPRARRLAALYRRATRDRPPSQGPPFPA